ncbi:PhzF family phenazine biosynthesis protein [Micromonospora auratinigra]|uniref:Phenazine biosynthesis protein PhzF family n=1 Tax=Micromonospora auratinigra TaxID=261654 RepID=A0A1A8Z8P2_9ACTN|nr:PhzF family phenazine biosynthesis protein [Micromonospora auratinigra]SBT40231.1 phenazine biosynthesis protein PhzF family [Micromonospora auratinigra]
MTHPVTLVRACRRNGRGGSPTAVVDGVPADDAQRRAVPVAAGASHAVFVSDGPDGVALRFFTATGELPACGHGTVAALAVLAARAGTREYATRLRSGGRTFTGRASWVGDGYEALFDPGPIALRAADAAERAPVLAALGLPTDASCRVASVGRPRLLVRVADRAALAALTPDMARLRAACDRAGLLGCYAHSGPGPDGRLAARMFAPSIGVPEDIANANSTACLAALLAGAEPTVLRVDMGDALGEPATVTATARPATARGAAGPTVRVGGTATIVGRLPLP